jgi:TRAP-type uncharacterized transport system substrate-binding protein
MKTSFRKTLSVLTLALLGLDAYPLAAAEPATVQVQTGPDLVFSAGRKDSGYWGVANRFKKVAGGQGLKVDVQESVGSLQNLERLEDEASSVNLALTQSDALHEYLTQHPTFSNHVTIVESIGLECIFFITSAQNNIQSETDLAKVKGFKIAVPSPESGVAVTYRNLSKLNPALAGTELVYVDSATALKALNAKGDGQVGALMIVLRPKERTPEIQQAIDQPEVYRFVSFKDVKFEAKLPDGQSIYSFLDLPLVRKKMQVEQSLPTVCTNGLLVASKDKIKPKTKQILEQIVSEQWMQIYSKEF